MGFMDAFSKVLGGKKPATTDSVKPPSQVLKENGIDPSNLQFKFNQDGSIGVSGQTDSQEECDRVCELIGEIPGVTSVQNDISISIPDPAPEIEVEEVIVEQAVVEDDIVAEIERARHTYTVQSGDTLWKIAEKMYGSGSNYMKIFEANTPLLEDPDKIYPGQELFIPDID